MPHGPLRATRGRAAQSAAEEREAAVIGELRAEIAAKSSVRGELDRRIAELRDDVRQFKTEARALVAERVRLEKSSGLQEAREARELLEGEAELARLLLVRDAMLASEGLRATNYRPTAWWLPMVSPDGRWFNKISDSMIARIEEL